MTAEAMNRTIAQWVGWNKRFAPWGPAWAPDPPDFTMDLNAIHEAEMKLTEDQVTEYDGYLFWVALRGKFSFCRATASQRAEALLRTIGKWED